MEASDLPSFLWIELPITACFLCEGSIEVVKGELELVGPGIRTHTVELSHCEHCGQWYGLLELLEQLLETDPVDPNELEGTVRVNGETLSFGVDLLEDMMAGYDTEPPDLLQALARELDLEDDLLDAFADMADLIGGLEDGGIGLLEPPEPYFTRQDEEDVRTFMKSARRFYRAQPWRRLEGHKYLAARFEGQSWSYFNVMGQEEDEPGLSYFEDWLQLCHFLHNLPDLFEQMTGAGIERQLRAAGAAESVVLFPSEEVSEEDLALLERLGLEPMRGGYPMPMRLTPERFTDPKRSLQEYSAVFDAVVTAVEKRRATPITSINETFEVEGIQVELRYPSKGAESLPEEPGAFRLIIRGRETGEAFSPLRSSQYIELEASGANTAEDIIRALRDLEENWWPYAFGSGEYAVWDDHFGRDAPSAYLSQLQDLDDLWIEAYEVRYPAELEALRGAAPETIQAAVRER